MDRKEYNDCMRPYLTGSKTKEQRQLDFCIGAKVCSGKAANQEEAKTICVPEDNTGETALDKIEETIPAAAAPTVKPMADWVKEEDEVTCRPCLLGPVVSWYRDTLIENNAVDLADGLVEKAASQDPLTLCQELDNIKNVVGESTRERLKDFDLTAQSFNPEDSTPN